MPLKKKPPKMEHLRWLKDDATQHPSLGTEGYFTSMDVVEIFPKIKMDAFQEWIRKEFIRPVVAGEGPTGWIKYFNRSGLCMIAMYKRFLDLGISRDYARTHMIAFHNLRVDHIKRNKAEPDYILLEIENKKVKAITVVSGNIALNRDMSDMVVINFYNIISKINFYIKG